MASPNEANRSDPRKTSGDQDDRLPKRGEPTEEATPEPGGTRGSDRGGSAGWGSEGSGGSVVDKRSPRKDK
ncbi:MAG: hypothetical protein ABR499_05040 [Gemmatimonadaceae bacterium]